MVGTRHFFTSPDPAQSPSVDDLVRSEGGRPGTAIRRGQECLTGRSVEVVSRGGLGEVLHEGLVIATHTRRHLPEQEARIHRQSLAASPSRPASDHVVVRKVDHSGSVSFAGAGYRVGSAYRGRHASQTLVMYPR